MYKRVFRSQKHIYNRIRAFFLAICLCVLFGTVMSTSCEKPTKSYTYRLARGGYYRNLGVLLFAVDTYIDGEFKCALLAAYEEESGTAKYLYPMDPGPFDFAWSQKEDIFIVTHGSQMSVFEKSNSSDDFTGTSVQCPINFLYTFCAWNPNGDWLAVNCYNLESTDCHLGLYNIQGKQLVVTNIAIEFAQAPVWQDNNSLFIPQNDSVVEVRIDSVKPQVVRRISIDKDAPQFYGVFNEQPLIHQKDRKIKLGSKTLVELDRHRKDALITTDKWIFVAPSSKNIVVFDHNGLELPRAKPTGWIKFGSIGANPNRVYGIIGSTLVSVFIENRNVNIEEVADLASF